MKCNQFIKNARNKIIIQKQQIVSDDYGGGSNSWVEVGKYWAWIKPVSVQEQFINVQMQGFVTQKVIIRYSDALKDSKTVASYRMKFEGRIYSIKGIENFDSTMRSYGRVFQQLKVVENEPEIS